MDVTTCNLTPYCRTNRYFYTRKQHCKIYKMIHLLPLLLLVQWSTLILFQWVLHTSFKCCMTSVQFINSCIRKHAATGSFEDKKPIALMCLLKNHKSTSHVVSLQQTGSCITPTCFRHQLAKPLGYRSRYEICYKDIVSNREMHKRSKNIWNVWQCMRCARPCRVPIPSAA